MKKKIIIPLVITLVAVIIIPVLITQLADGEDPVITNFYPTVYKTYSGQIEVGMEAEDNSGTVFCSIYFNDELVSDNNTFLCDTTSFEDGTIIVVVFKAEDKRGNFVTETTKFVIDNFIDPVRTDVFKVVSYNIWESGEEVWGYNGELRRKGWWRYALQEENPDIAVLVETGSLDDRNNYELNNSLNRLSAFLYDEAPYEGYTEQGIMAHTDGEAIISRYPIINFTQILEYPLDDETIHDYHHGFCDAVIDINGIYTHVIGYHGKCCNNTGEEPPEREKEVEGILNYVDDLGDVPIIWAGDFNAFSPVDTADPNLAPLGNLGDEPLTMILDPDDPTWGQYSSKVHNFTDVYRTLNPNLKGYSFGQWETQYWSRIDYIIVNQHWADKIINSTVGDTPSANTSSDHYALDCFFSLDENYSYSDPIPKVIVSARIKIMNESNPLLIQIKQRFVENVFQIKDIF